MRIIHLSDLHFGTEVPGLLQNLITHLQKMPADLIIISGDFTQIASTAEFESARNFLESLQTPYFCIPGNHDIPRFHFFERMMNPYTRYKKFFGPHLDSFFDNGEICIVGINTARRVLPHWNWAHGAVSRRQLAEAKRLYDTSPSKTRVFVMHHPVHKAKDNDFNTIVFGGRHALDAIKAMKIDLVLTGHVHHASITTMETTDHKTVFLSASTALSRRRRKSANGYNVITLTGDDMVIEIFSYQKEVFELLERTEYKLL